MNIRVRRGWSNYNYSIIYYLSIEKIQSEEESSQPADIIKCCMSIFNGASQVSTKKRDLAIFWWDRQYFCLIIKQKAGWLVGI
jgi:hypothetical protein